MASKNFTVYLNIPPSVDYSPIYWAFTKNEAIGIAKEIPNHWNVFIINAGGSIQYDRNGNPMK